MLHGPNADLNAESITYDNGTPFVVTTNVYEWTYALSFSNIKTADVFFCSPMLIPNVHTE